MEEKYFKNDMYWKEHINKKLDIDMWIDEYREYFGKSGYCLDLGCGIGQHSKRLMEYGYEVLSADISDIALNEVKKFNNNVIKLDMSKPFKFKNDTFDLIFSSLSIHYFSDEDTKKLINEIYRVLKKDGLFIGSVNGLEGYNLKEDSTTKLEENFYLNKEKYIHLFDERELKKYFSNFNILKIEKREVERFGFKKIYWIFIIRK